jgi:6-phospho 3-hexuloisomerase
MMNHVEETMKEIATTTLAVSEKLDSERIEEFIESLLEADKIFVLGAGYSRLIAEALALRIMSIGLTAHVVGDITAPGIKEGDVLVAISRSGETLGVVTLARRAREVGGRVVAITSTPDSTLAKLAHLTIEVKDRVENHKYPALSILGDRTHSEMYGTMFFVITYALLQGICIEIAMRTNQTPDLIDSRHANLE